MIVILYPFEVTLSPWRIGACDKKNGGRFGFRLVGKTNFKPKP